MNLELLSPKRMKRKASAAVFLVAAIGISGCAGKVQGLQVAPDGLDFDYTVDTGAALGVVRAFGDQGKTVVVLDRPLPGDIRSVPIYLQGGVQGSADVQGNYIILAGKPDRFTVLLPAGKVDVVRSTAPTQPPRESGGELEDSPQAEAATHPDDGEEIESNLDWGAVDGQRAGAATYHGGQVPARPAGPSDGRQGPLPTSIE